MHFLINSQWDVVGDSLGLYEVFGLMLGNHMPADSVVDAVLQQHGPVHCVGLIQSNVTAVCLCYAADLQHKHDLAARRQTDDGLERGNVDMETSGLFER